MGKPKTGHQTIIAHERSYQALELRKAGASYDTIARQLGYAGKAGAYRAVDRALNAIVAVRNKSAESVLEIELARLDDMLLGLWADARKGRWLAVDRVLKIMERRAAYLGLDAPQRRELSGPDGAAIQVEQDVNLTLSAEQRLERLTYLIESVRSRTSGSLASGLPDMDTAEGATD